MLLRTILSDKTKPDSIVKFICIKVEQYQAKYKHFIHLHFFVAGEKNSLFNDRFGESSISWV